MVQTVQTDRWIEKPVGKVLKLNIAPHANQKLILDDPHRFIYVEAARKFGKSVCGMIWQAVEMSARPGYHYFIAPYLKQGKEIAWDKMQIILNKEAVKKIDKTDRDITLKNNAVWKLRGAEDPNALRGPGAQSVVIDEARDVRYAYFWDEIVRPELMYTKGRGLILTSKPGNWVRKFRDKELHDPQWKTFLFKSSDNPLIDPQEIEILRKTLSATAFRKEILNEDVEFHGLVYPEFNEAIHVVPPFEIPKEWPVFAGLDWGLHAATAVIFFAINPNTRAIYGFYEHYYSDRTVSWHAEILKSFLNGRRCFFICDPTMGRREGGEGRTLMDDFRKHGIYLVPGNNKDKTRSRSIVKDYLTANPSLKFFLGMTRTFTEFESYQYISYPEGDERNANEKTVDTNDNAINAIEYVLTYIKDNFENRLPVIITKSMEEKIRTAREDARKPFKKMIEGTARKQFDWRDYKDAD